MVIALHRSESNVSVSIYASEAIHARLIEADWVIMLVVVLIAGGYFGTDWRQGYRVDSEFNTFRIILKTIFSMSWTVMAI